MSIVKVVFDKEKDLYNVWETANHKGSFGANFKEKLNSKIIEICSGKKFEDAREKLEKYYSHVYHSILMSDVVESFSKSWEQIEKEYFQRLKKITGKEFPCKRVSAFITTSSRCPYNPEINNPSFFVSFFSGIPNAMKNFGHELMHIHFHNTYWPEVEKQIGKEKTADLKEALTVLLNLEFQDLWIVQDEGYLIHKELRAFISSEWKKQKDFDILIEQCVEYLKHK